MCEGKLFRLEYDWEKTDQYGKILACVLILEGGTELFLNAEIIKQGYGHAYLRYPFKDNYMRRSGNTSGRLERMTLGDRERKERSRRRTRRRRLRSRRLKYKGRTETSRAFLSYDGP